MLKKMSEECIRKNDIDFKIGLLVTKDDFGYPHITLITSLQPNNSNQLIWGQISAGTSKKNILSDPKVGFLMMNFDLEMWRGKAVWTHSEITGPEIEMYNSKTANRYNAYGGVGRVHYMDLVEITEEEKLEKKSMISGALKTRISAKRMKRKHRNETILNAFSEKLVKRLDSLKFVAYIGNDGFPVIIPAVQASASDSGRIVFSQKPFGDELAKIPKGSKTALFCISLSLEEIMIKGIFKGFKKANGIKTGYIDIEKVYNPLLPLVGYIYPLEKLEPVTEF